MKPGPFGIVRKPVSSAANTSSTQASMLARTSSNVRSKGNGIAAPLFFLWSHRSLYGLRLVRRRAQILDDGIEIPKGSQGIGKTSELFLGCLSGLPLAVQFPYGHTCRVSEGDAAN